MNFRLITLASLALALAGCTTVGPAGNAVEARWKGQPAGAFFAKFGPPTSDVAAGDSTVYSWRGGYKTRQVPAVYAELPNGKKGKLVSRARSEYLRCEVQLTVSSSYVIQSIRTVIDKPGVKGGPSYCEEFLGGA